MDTIAFRSEDTTARMVSHVLGNIRVGWGDVGVIGQGLWGVLTWGL